MITRIKNQAFCGNIYPLDLSDDYYFLPFAPEKRETCPTGPVLPSFDCRETRNDFPIFRQKINGRPLIWLDNAATSQKPRQVIDALVKYYSEYNSNIHRGVHTLANRATDAYEEARRKVQIFLGASSPEEIIFVRGTTEAINLVAQTYGRETLHKGGEIILTAMEHHSNIVPWQMLQNEKQAALKVIPMDEHGQLLLDEYEKLLSKNTRLVAITHVSNVLGTINPLRTMIEMAHHYGARVLVDGAQGAPHLSVNVQEMDADFYTFSGHKTYGPTGIGVLYGKKSLLEEMPPWQGGGGMIKQVSFQKTIYNKLPEKFEAGTVNIADAIGLGAAIDYMQDKGLKNIEQYELGLTSYAMVVLSAIPGVRIIGDAPAKISVISFTLDNHSPEDTARYLDQAGIAVRAGHHCAQPVLQRFGVKSTIRASLAMYNTREDIDAMADVLYNL